MSSHGLPPGPGVPPRCELMERESVRIIYVINGFDRGGAEHGLATLLEKGFFAGHDVQVLALCRGQGDLAYRVADSFPGVVEFVTANPRLTLWSIVAGIYKIRKKIMGADVLVLSLKQANIAGRIAALFVPIRCVSFEHMPEYRARRWQWVYRVLLKMLSFRVDEVWADCRVTLQETERYFSTRQRCARIVPLYESSAVSSKSSYELSDVIKIVMAGRLIERKRVDLMIEALVILRDQGISSQLSIFGDGPDRERLETLVESHRLGDCVEFCGYVVNWEEKAERADFFVNASEVEGFCIVVAEAMGRGLPAVITDVGGIKDYGQHGFNCLKVTDATPSAFAEAVAALSADREAREALGRSAVRTIRERYGPGSIAAAGERILQVGEGSGA